MNNQIASVSTVVKFINNSLEWWPINGQYLGHVCTSVNPNTNQLVPSAHHCKCPYRNPAHSFSFIYYLLITIASCRSLGRIMPKTSVINPPKSWLTVCSIMSRKVEIVEDKIHCQLLYCLSQSPWLCCNEREALLQTPRTVQGKMLALQFKN